MVRRMLSFILMYMFLTVLSLYAAYNLHCMLLGQSELCNLSLEVAINGALSVSKIRQLFIIINLLAITLLFLIMFTGSFTIKSGWIYVTPTVKTPAAAGKNECGSARWMKKREYKKCFNLHRFSEYKNRNEN